MSIETSPAQSASLHTDPAASAKPPQQNIFDAAKSVVQTLGDLKTKAEQERALRYAAEELGITLGAPATAPQDPAARAAPVGLTPPQPPFVRPKDIKSFKEEKQPKSDSQYAAVVAYYYRFEAPEEQRRETINAEALQESTRQSGYKRLAAPRMTLTNALAVGYLDRAGRGEYKINTVGENLVAMTLPGSADNGVSRPPGGRKKVTKKAPRGTNKRARRRVGR